MECLRLGRQYLLLITIRLKVCDVSQSSCGGGRTAEGRGEGGEVVDGQRKSSMTFIILVLHKRTSQSNHQVAMVAVSHSVGTRAPTSHGARFLLCAWGDVSPTSFVRSSGKWSQTYRGKASLGAGDREGEGLGVTLATMYTGRRPFGYRPLPGSAA